MIEEKLNYAVVRHYDYMMIALVPLIICACFMYTSRVLLICGVAMLTARAVDVAAYSMRKQEIDLKDKSSTVRALTFVMMLPVSIPLYIVVMSVAVAIFMGKHAFGGKDVYPFNLAALAMCIAAVNWPGKVFTAVKPFTNIDFWSGAGRVTVTGASQIKAGGVPYISLFDLLLGNHAGSMGNGYIIIIAAVGIFLITTKCISWHIPATFLATCTAWRFLFPRIYGVSRIYSLKFEILSSAVLFYRIFMLNEPATTPANPKAKLMFGALCGVVTMFFRYFGSYEIGGCFAILIVNATESFWDRLFEGDTKLSALLPEGLVSRLRPKTKQYKADPKKTYKDDSEGAALQKKLTAKAEKEAAQKQARKTARKPARKKPDNRATKPATKEKQSLSARDTFDIIAQAEDDIDQVEFSTRSIDVAAALKRYEEKYGKEGK